MEEVKFYDFSDYEYYALIGVLETEKEKVEDFKKQIDLGNKTCIRYGENRWVLLLIDGSLL